MGGEPCSVEGCQNPSLDSSPCCYEHTVDRRQEERRTEHRRKAELTQALNQLTVVAAAVNWRQAEAGDSRTKAALALRDAVDRLLDLDERGMATAEAIAWGLAASGATLLFWYGPGTWLAAAGAWIGAGALGWLAWRRWHPETYEEHLYGDCPRCNRLPIDCPTLDRIARREARR